MLQGGAAAGPRPRRSALEGAVAERHGWISTRFMGSYALRRAESYYVELHHGMAYLEAIGKLKRDDERSLLYGGMRNASLTLLDADCVGRRALVSAIERRNRGLGHATSARMREPRGLKGRPSLWCVGRACRCGEI